MADRGGVVIVFELGYTDPPLRSNKRLHHMAEHRLKADIRRTGKVQAQAHMGIRHPLEYPLPYLAEIVMIWTVPTRHRRDADSGQPTLKSWVDGAVDAGLLHDDSWVHVQRMWCEIEYKPNEPMALRVEIREVKQ
jgi:hypothetical protein